MPPHRAAVARFSQLRDARFRAGAGAERVRRTKRARQEQPARSDRDARDRKIVSRARESELIRSGHALGARSAAKRASRPAACDLRCTIARARAARARASTSTARASASRDFSASASRDVRAGRFGAGLRRAGAAPRVPQRRARADLAGAIIASWRATARSCSKRPRCCAARIAADRGLLFAYNDASGRPGRALIARAPAFVAALGGPPRRVRALGGTQRAIDDRLRSQRAGRRADGDADAMRSRARCASSVETELRAQDARRPAPRRAAAAARRRGARRVRLAGATAHGGTGAQGRRIRVDARRAPATRRSCCSTTCSPSSTPSAPAAFLAAVGDFEQAFLTATDLPSPQFARARRGAVERGRVGSHADALGDALAALDARRGPATPGDPLARSARPGRGSSATTSRAPRSRSRSPATRWSW